MEDIDLLGSDVPATSPQLAPSNSDDTPKNPEESKEILPDQNPLPDPNIDLTSSEPQTPLQPSENPTPTPKPNQNLPTDLPSSDPSPSAPIPASSNSNPNPNTNPNTNPNPNPPLQNQPLPRPSIYPLEKMTDISLEEFNKQHTHLIVMTEAGKPVYTRFGDEAEISPIVATLNVIINKVRRIKLEPKDREDKSTASNGSTDISGSSAQSSIVSEPVSTLLNKSGIKRLENNTSKTIIMKRYGLYFVYITKDKNRGEFSIQMAIETVAYQVNLA